MADAPVKPPALMIDHYGDLQEIAPDDLATAAQAGYVPASPKQISEYRLQQKYGGGLDAAKAFAEHAASALTLGASDVAERGLGISTPEAMRGREQANPVASGLGTAAGIAVPLLIPGVGEASAPGLVARAGQAVTRGVAEALPEAAGVAGRLAAKALAAGTGSAVEGAAYGLGQVVHEAALGDPNLTAQSALATIGFSAALGGGLSATAGVLGKLAGAAGEKLAAAAPGWLEGVEAHANLQAAGGDKTLARWLGKKFGKEGSTKVLLELRDEGILTGVLNTPETVMERSRDALDKYGQQIGDMVQRASGKVDAAPLARQVLDEGTGIAAKLSENPFQEAAAQRLQNTLAKYEQKFARAAPTLSDLHTMEREFGEEVYGLKGTRDPRANREIDALNTIRRRISNVVDDAVAEAGLPASDWKAANRGYAVAKVGQRLAQNGMDRIAGNNPISLSAMIGGAAGMAHAGPLAGAVSLGTTQLGKRYGSGVLGAAARAMREAIEPGAAEAVVNKTADAIGAERSVGIDLVNQQGSTAPEAVATLSLLERMNQATEKKIVTRVGALVRGETGAGLAKSFAASPEDARAALAQRTEGIRKLANNPDLLQGHLTAQTDDWHQHAPNTAQALQVTSARGVAFLASKLPQNAGAGPLSQKWTPTRAETSKFNRYYEAVNRPTSILKQAAAGTLTPEAIEAVATVYPELYAKIRGAIVEKLAGSPKNIPYKSKLMMTMLLGKDLDGTTSPHALMGNMQAFAPPAPPKAAPSRADKLTLASRMRTPMQSSAERK